jgi:hypothetical protein
MHRSMLVVVALVFACGNSRAQSTPLTPTTLNVLSGLAGRDAAAPQLSGAGPGPFGGQGPVPFGSGDQPLLRFAGDNGPQNVLMFSLVNSIGYNDNINGTNQNAYGDFFTEIGPRVSFFTAQKRLDVSLDYAPDLFLYKNNSSADSLNQNLVFRADLELSPRIQLEVRDNVKQYSYGLSGDGRQLLPGLGPPGGPILYSIIPKGSTAVNTSRLDLLFTKSERTVIDVFGDSNTEIYGGPYINSQEVTGGLSYSYRVSRRGSFSATYVYVNSLFLENQPGISFEGAQGGSRFATQSLFLSYAYKISQTTSVSFWGGPERTHLGETLVSSLPPSTIPVFTPVRRFEWDWAAGGSMTTTTRNTAISLIAFQALTNGGGLLTAVNGDFALLGIARRLPHGWQWDSSLSYGLSQQLSFGGLLSGRFDAEIGQVSLTRKLGRQLSFAIDYWQERQSQRGGNNLKVADIDRTVARIRLDWEVKKIPLGRHGL